jgi:hypothetical protein
MCGVCRVCSRLGHDWMLVEPYIRRCLRCGLRERLSYFWIRREEKGECWVPADKKVTR